MLASKDDLSYIENALKRAQEYAEQGQHGGLGELCDDLAKALVVLEQVRLQAQGEAE